MTPPYTSQEDLFWAIFLREMPSLLTAQLSDEPNLAEVLAIAERSNAASGRPFASLAGQAQAGSFQTAQVEAESVEAESVELAQAPPLAPASPATLTRPADTADSAFANGSRRSSSSVNSQSFTDASGAGGSITITGTRSDGTTVTQTFEDFVPGAASAGTSGSVTNSDAGIAVEAQIDIPGGQPLPFPSAPPTPPPSDSGAEPVAPEAESVAPTPPAVPETPTPDAPAVPEPAVPEPAVPEPAVPEPGVSAPGVLEPKVPEPESTEPDAIVVGELETPEPEASAAPGPVPPQTLEPGPVEAEIPEPDIPAPDVPEPNIPEPELPGHTEPVESDAIAPSPLESRESSPAEPAPSHDPITGLDSAEPITGAGSHDLLNPDPLNSDPLNPDPFSLAASDLQTASFRVDFSGSSGLPFASAEINVTFDTEGLSGFLEDLGSLLQDLNRFYDRYLANTDLTVQAIGSSSSSAALLPDSSGSTTPAAFDLDLNSSAVGSACL